MFVSPAKVNEMEKKRKELIWMTIYFHGLPGWLQLQQHFTGENKINSGVRKKKKQP